MSFYIWTLLRISSTFILTCLLDVGNLWGHWISKRNYAIVSIFFSRLPFQKNENIQSSCYTSNLNDSLSLCCIESSMLWKFSRIPTWLGWRICRYIFLIVHVTWIHAGSRCPKIAAVRGKYCSWGGLRGVDSLCEPRAFSGVACTPQSFREEGIIRTRASIRQNLVDGIVPLQLQLGFGKAA